MSKAGRFEIDVSSPYPCTCRLTMDSDMNGFGLIFSHTELKDLKYAVERAEWEARQHLKRVGLDHEVQS